MGDRVENDLNDILLVVADAFQESRDVIVV